LPRGYTTPRQNRATFSLAIVDEINLVGYDAGFAAQLEKTLQKDLRHAKKLSYEAWNLRPLIDKILELISIPIKEPL
jgi:cardiolipin synthase